MRRGRGRRIDEEFCRPARQPPRKCLMDRKIFNAGGRQRIWPDSIQHLQIRPLGPTGFFRALEISAIEPKAPAPSAAAEICGEPMPELQQKRLFPVILSELQACGPQRSYIAAYLTELYYSTELLLTQPKITVVGKFWILSPPAGSAPAARKPRYGAAAFLTEL